MTLGLDPKNFTQGQKAAAASLQQLRQQASTTSISVQRSGAGIVSFFQNVQHPVNALHQAFARLATTTLPTSPLQQNLTQLAARGRVAGAGVQAGALAGASGLRVMGIAGLAAFAAVAAGYKLMKEAKENANDVFRTGLGSKTAGMDVTQFSAISQVLLKNANVPEERTREWLEQTRQWQARLKYGEGTERLAPFQQIGADLNPFKDTPEQMAQKLARRFNDPTEFPRTPEGESKAIAEGGRLNLTPDLVIGLRKVGENLEKLTLAERKRAVTEEQTKSADEALESLNDLALAFNDLKRTLWVELNPVVKTFADALKAVVTFLKGNAILKFLREKLGVGAAEGDDRTWWERNAPAALGGKAARANIPKPGAAAKPGDAAGAAPTTSGYSSPATAAAGRFIAQEESGDRDINNFNYDKPGARRMGPDGVEVGSTAGGYHMMLDSNWVKYAKQLGIDTAKYPRAKGTPKAIQEAVFSAMYDKEGVGPWSSAAGGPMTPAKIAEMQSRIAAARGVKVAPLSNMANSGVRRAGAGPTGGWPFPVQKGNISLPPNKTNYSEEGGPGYPSTASRGRYDKNGRLLDDADIPASKNRFGLPHLEMIRRHNAAAQASSVNNTTNNRAVNTGDINVHTQATSPAGIGGAVQGAIKRMVTESNTGLI